MKNIYFLTDIHGQYYLFDAITEWIEPDSTLIFGGDANDRGPAGYRIMRELLDNPQVVYLKGNHEDLFVKAAHAIIGFCAQSDKMYALLQSKDRQIAENIVIACSNPDVQLHLANGGGPTLVEWIVGGADQDFIDRIENLPLTFTYENIDFCHAGATYEIFKRVNDAEYDKKLPKPVDSFDLLWDRKQIALGWESNRIGVFGHTPTVNLPSGIYGRDKSISRSHPCAWQDKMGAIHKRSGWKIDMDTAAVWTNRAYLLNCLTMKVYGFYDENNIIKIIDEYKII